MAVVKAMRKHIAHLAGGGEFLHLPPAQESLPPVLKPIGPEVIRPANKTAVHQVRHVSHGRHEAISKRRHMPHIRLLRGLQHRQALRIIHGNRLLAQHVLAQPNRRQRNRRMQVIGRRDHNRVE